MIVGIGYFLFFLVAFLTLTILLIWPVFPYVVLAILLAYLLHPVEARLQKAIPSAAVRAGLLTLFVTIAVALPLVYAVQRITREIASGMYVGRIRQLLDSAKGWLVGHNAAAVADWMSEGLEQSRDFLLASIPNLFGSVFNMALGIFVCLFVFYYFIKEGAGIWKAFLEALPLPTLLKSQLTQEVGGILRAIFFGQLLTALAQGLLAGLGYVIFEVPQPFLWMSATMLVAFFPVFGTPLVWGPAALLKLMAGQTWQGVGLAIYGFVLVMNIDNFLRPRLIAFHTQVHPVVILIGIIGGTKVFGFIGFLVGPVIFAIFLQLLRFFVEYQPVETETPAPTVRV
ncbi:MAG: hypothetical protein A3H28_05895 [Acidobacteria bacterium RIFCSPLOWO2_02_FULL_61_28]|nr:MAG: hypothetical protein A3H28_05895 [Acidobacteria bacterium RIFCSPLOWO2_02_FULL_61_28]